MSSDPDALRDTPLALKLKAQIARDGPMELSRFICACLWDRVHGYYATKAVIGRAGDFVTAPEISQIFGELLGLWSAVVWQSMGAPAAVKLVEFGPGRGTLMTDALRAIAKVPGMPAAMTVVMVEQSAGLRRQQQNALANQQIPITWVEASRPSDAPMILLGNEFIDVFGPDQSVKTPMGWRWRAVALDEGGQFQFAPSLTTRLRPELDQRWPDAPVGSICEQLRTNDLAAEFKALAAGQPFAALFVDYGHLHSDLGETLQAVRQHAYEHPLCSPGEADLTMQVDFEDLAREMAAAGFTVDGPITQAEFLGRLGIIERASKLMAANPQRATEIEAGVARLMAPNGMGTRFKAIGIRSADVPKLPGF